MGMRSYIGLVITKEKTLKEVLSELPKYPPNSDREELVIKNIKEIIEKLIKA